MLVRACGEVPSGASTRRTIVRSRKAGRVSTPRPSASAVLAAIPTATTAASATVEDASRPAAAVARRTVKRVARVAREGPGPIRAAMPGATTTATTNAPAVVSRKPRAASGRNAPGRPSSRNAGTASSTAASEV